MLMESKDNLILSQLHQNLNHSTSLPGKIRLMNGKEVIKYHTPNKTKEPEQYFHHPLMLYYPWRQETELLVMNKLTCQNSMNLKYKL